MAELYPIIKNNKIAGFISSGGDSTRICLRGECKYYLWISKDAAVNVTRLLDRRGVLRTKNASFPLAPWTRTAPPLNVRVAPDLDEYVRWLARNVRDQIRDKRVVLGFSGGKDSLATLIVLLKLKEFVNFKLDVVYVRIPFIESLRNLEFVKKVEEKLDIKISIFSTSRRNMKSLLLWKGLPKRGYRYCTVYKVRPMREIRKEDPSAIEVVADRITESPKRFLRLSKALKAKMLIVGRKFRPTYILSLFDVIEIVKREGLVHPDYIEGLPRVACSLCPYKVLFEFKVRHILEDENLIERVMRKEWSKRYNWISFEEFKEQHLWRFKVPVARRLYLIKNETQNIDERIGSDDVLKMYKEVWSSKVKVPELEDPWKVLKLI